jgi:TonB family protein
MAVSPTFTGPQGLRPQQDWEHDLNVLPSWREPLTTRRLAPSIIGTIVFHIIVVILWIAGPEAPDRESTTTIHAELRTTPLYMPRDFEPTQKDPNQGKVSHELDVRSMQYSPERQAPRLQRPSPPPGPVVQVPKPVELPAIETPKLEPPKIDVPVAPPAITAVAPKPVTPAPPEKPKLAFEDVGPGPPRNAPSPDHSVPLPKDLVPDPLRNSSAAGGGGTIVGDIGDSLRASPNSVHAPSSGDIKSSMQLLSDAKGVDFKPYMIQVLMAVRRNWLAILPESARNGRRGRVVVQFAIDRTGGVPKVVIAEGTGADALDRAAVAAISASVPLPPLPAEYKGDQIKLQFAFSYNMPSH